MFQFPDPSRGSGINAKTSLAPASWGGDASIPRDGIRQRAKIRARHSGEEFFFQGVSDKNAPVMLEKARPANVILREIDSLKGLNVEGRSFFNGRARSVKKVVI